MSFFNINRHLKMEFHYGKNKRMNQFLICCGFTYNLKRTSKATNPSTHEPLSKLWRCSEINCNASVTIEHNKISKINGEISEKITQPALPPGNLK